MTNQDEGADERDMAIVLLARQLMGLRREVRKFGQSVPPEGVL